MKLRMSGIMKSSSSSACSFYCSSSSAWSGRVPWEGPSQATAAALMFWRASHTIEGGGGCSREWEDKRNSECSLIAQRTLASLFSRPISKTHIQAVLALLSNVENFPPPPSNGIESRRTSSGELFSGGKFLYRQLLWQMALPAKESHSLKKGTCLRTRRQCPYE